ncbi:MAG TPA: PAS domain S-box protein [Blastocatellia bacterium]
MKNLPQTVKPEMGSLKVLLFEDNSADAEHFVEMFMRAGKGEFQTSVAASLQEGLLKLAQEQIDIVLLDLNLPDSQGLRTLTQVQARNHNVPIVIVTGLQDEALASKAVHAGAEDYLFKGHLDPAMVKRVVRYAVERNHTRREELQASEARLRTIIENDADGVVAVDMAGLIRFVNPAAVAILGRPREDLVGSLFVAPVAIGESADIEIPSPGGEVRHVEMRVVEIDWEGERAFLASLRDLTDRRLAEQALRDNAVRLRLTEERLRLALENAEMGMWDWDVTTGTVIYNDKWAELHAYSRSGFMKDIEAWRTCVHPEDLASFEESLRRHLASDDSLFDVEYRVRATAGHTWINARGRVHRRDGQGNPLRMMGTVTDVTGRKLITRRLEAFASELARSNKELQDFAMIASHDLQEPLRKIQMFASDVADSSSALDDESKDSLRRVVSAAARMQQLVSDLLTLSRVTSRSQPFAPVDMDLVVSEVLSDLEAVIAESGARVEIGPLPAIEAEPLHMRQLFQNLIGNALKFRAAGRDPVIKVNGELIRPDGPLTRDGGLAPKAGRCRIIVEDNGIGFDERHLDRIFGVFQRLHDRSAYDGTGIGLAICRKIAERHHGQITATSTPGHGAAFIVTLPVTQVERPLQ